MKTARLTLALILLSACSAFADSFTSPLDRVDAIWFQITNETAAAVAQTSVVDLDALRVSKIAAQIAYAPAVIPAVTFNDGQQSSATITVSSNPALSSAPAYDLLTISSNTAIATGAWVSVNGNYLVMPYNFKVDLNYSTNTAVSFANAVNFSSYGVTASTIADNVVKLTVRQYGQIGNAYTLLTSTVALLANTSYFASGRDPATVKIGSIPFQNGVDWNTGTTSSASAKSLSDAIMANLITKNLVSTTWTVAGVILSSSQGINHNDYTLFTTTQGALTVSSQGVVITTYADGSALSFYGNGYGSSMTVTTGSFSSINVPNNFSKGLPLLYNKTAGNSPGSLVSQTTYFATNVQPVSFQLALTATGAASGTALAIATQNAAGGGSFSLTPLSFSGNATFKWEVSNDSVSWQQVQVATTCYSSTVSTSTVWDFGTLDQRWLRLNYSTPTAGAVSHKTTINGRP